MAGTAPVFKIGDRVRVLRITDSYGPELHGVIGTIAKLPGPIYMLNGYGVDFERKFGILTHDLEMTLPETTGRWIHPENLELVEPGIPPLTIGPHKVTDVTRDSVKVGCQTVTREQVLAVQTAMDAAKPVFQKKVYSCGHTSICRTSPNIWQISRTGYESSGEFLTLDRNQLDDLRIAIDNAVRDV